MSDTAAEPTRCAVCLLPIVHETVKTPGYLPRTGWSDGHPRSPFLCASALDLTHRPEQVTT